MTQIFPYLIAALAAIGCLVGVYCFKHVKSTKEPAAPVDNTADSASIETPYWYVTAKDKSLSIWVSSKGKFFVYRVSATGKPYRHYLHGELEQSLRKELLVDRPDLSYLFE